MAAGVCIVNGMNNNKLGMKRLLLKLIVLTFLMVPGYLYAYDFQVGGIYYNININGNSVGVTNGDVLYQGNIEIPSDIIYNDKNYQVTNIGNFAFANCLELTSVTIPTSVIAINSYAFHRCSGLTSVNIPNSVMWIRERAFQGCSSLTSVIIPNSVTFIDGSAFSGCSSLNSIMVDNGNSNYDSRDNCNAIIETSSNTLIFGCKKTVIPNSVTNIGNNAFSYCSGLTSLAIPDGVTSIGDEAFEGCSNLSSITIHDGVSTIGNSVFKGCTNLNSIILPNSVLSIGSQAFRECSSLKTIDIGNCVTSIGNQAFFGCRGINSFTIPNSVKKIDDYAFAYCSGLTTIKIPNSVTELGGYSFEECTNLTSVSISNSIKEIKLWTFYGCKNLKSVTIPNSVTTIGGNAFMHCTSLKSIDIPSSVTTIEDGAFERCTGLVSFTIPNTISTIAGGVLEGCSSLSSITIPSSVTSIGRIAFYKCEALTSIISEIQEPFPLTADKVFSDVTYSRAVLTVPKGTKATYQSTVGWNSFRNIVEVGGPIEYTLSIKSEGNGYASYNGESVVGTTKTFNVQEGANATITFAPDNGYRIKSVKVNSTDVTSSVSNNSYTISSISANTALEVEFEAIPIPTYTLSVTASGNGSATYNGTTAKNNTQTFTLNEGTSATITFAPDNGYRIKIVKVNSADVTSSVSNNSYTVSNIKANTTLEVEFEAIPIPTYTLSVKSTGNGSATYDGTTAKNGTKSFTLNEGTSVTITFAPDNGYRIKSVKVNSTDVTSSVSNNQYTVSNIKANTAVEVEFEIIPVVINTYTLSVKATGNGSAAYNGTTARNNTQSFTLNEGTSATITFAPDNGYRIKSVKLNSTDVTSGVSNNSYTVSIISNTTVEVEFEAIPIPTYTLSISATGNGSATYNGTSAKNNTQTFTLNEGTSATITFAPDNGYRIKSVKVNGADVTSSVSNNSYTVSISGNTTIEVEFEAIPANTYILKYVVDGEAYKTYELKEGDAITPEPNPQKDGYSFSGWSEIPATMPAEDVTITGTFTKNEPEITTYVLSVKAMGSGSASFDGTTIVNNTQTFTVNEGASITVTFSPDNGYRIKSVKVNGTDVTSNVSYSQYTVNNINTDTTVEVEFEAIPVNTYTLKYVVDGETYKTFELEEGAVITPEAEPTKEGYAFSGWSEIPATMPAEDVTITGTFTKNEPEEQTYTLTIGALGNGYISYNNIPVQNDTQSFSIEAGVLAIVTIHPDEGYQNKKVTINGLELADLSTMSFTIDAMDEDVTIEVEFEQMDSRMTINGVNYEVVSFSDHTMVVADGDYGQTLEVPATVNKGNDTWTVMGLKNGALDQNENLAAVIWDPSAVFNARVSNPNLLLYVKDKAYASYGVNNVIVNGTAESIELTDASSGNDFYCPRAFKAKKISYSHRYNMETGLGDSKGWETIVLPFDVQKYTSPKGEIVPFTKWTNSDSKKPFWLFELTASGYKDVEGIKANTPYIISMPNNSQYLVDYVIIGLVTFSAENAEVKASDEMLSANYQDRTFVPNYTNKAGEDYLVLNVNNYYVTNPGTDIDGSKFIKGLRAVHPFEAYMTTTSNTRSIDVMDGMTTAIRDIVMTAEGKDIIKVYDTRGILVKTMKAGDDLRKGLAAGVYIVNGKKMIIK